MVLVEAPGGMYGCHGTTTATELYTSDIGLDGAGFILKYNSGPKTKIDKYRAVTRFSRIIEFEKYITRSGYRNISYNGLFTSHIVQIFSEHFY